MKKVTFFKVFTVLVGFLMLFSTSSIIFPLIEPGKPQSSQGVALTIIVSDQQIPGIQNVTDDFLASPLGNGVDSVTIMSSGITAEDQLIYLQSLLTSGTATNHVIGLDLIWLAKFASSGWITELDPYLDQNELDDFNSGLVKACIYQGKAYAYPYFLNLGTLYYRKDLLDLHLPGWTEMDFDTWEELNATANYILNNVTGLLDNPNLVGYVGQLDAYEGGVINFLEWCGSNGVVDIVTSEDDVNINTQDVNDAMQFLKDLIAPQYTGVQGNDYIIPRSGLIDDEGSSVARWLANNSIFMRQWNFAYRSSEGANIEFGIAPLPHFAGATGYKTSCAVGTALAIPTDTLGTARQAAINLTKFMGEELAQEAELTSDADPGPGYYPLSNFPALKSVYSNPPTGFEWIKNWTDQIDLTLSRPIHQEYPQISTIIADYFQDLLSGQLSVSDALSDMERDIKEIIWLPPGNIVLSTNAGTPDDDGIFNLTWTSAERALNYSVYKYSNYITKINGSLTVLMSETHNLSLPLNGYTDGTYYFIVVAYNNYGNISSNCIAVIVKTSPEPREPTISGYDTFLIIIVISIVLKIFLKKRCKQIGKA